MSKVSKYLNEHILGEVVADSATLNRFSTDGSVLHQKPELVIYPRTTSDIRKVARFSWQLAEKGHVLPLTARGDGTDTTGAAIGKGVIISMTEHMNQIFEFDSKQKLVRVQPGVSSQALQAGLALHSMGIPSLEGSNTTGTLGGAAALNASNERRASVGTTLDWINQLEVVLANGDLMQTGRISKRALNKKKGEAGMEADIYRALDGLIEDNKSLIDEKLGTADNDFVGYSAISQVKRKDGSIDLTPLIVGSQGTLGIISEMIMKTDFINNDPVVSILTFDSSEKARDAVDEISKLRPAAFDLFSAEFFEAAKQQGKKYPFLDDDAAADTTILIVQFDDFSARVQKKNLKKLSKIADLHEVKVFNLSDEKSQQPDYVSSAELFGNLSSSTGASAPPLTVGAFVPTERLESFSVELERIAKKYYLHLPLHIRLLDGVVSVRPSLNLQKIGDKQKVFKLLSEFSIAVDAHSGHLIGEGGEGRLKTIFAQKFVDKDVLELFDKIRAIFDPHGTLNPEVKQQITLKSLSSQLRSDFN